MALLHHAEQEFTEQFQMTGPLMSLGGRVHYLLANPLESATGSFDSTFVSTSPSQPTGPLAHEWLHAVE